MKCRWGVLGAGRIAGQFVAQIPASRSGTLAAVASTDLARARALTAGTGNAVAYGDYESLLADPDIDAVYIATLHPRHAGLIAACARAGKHVLCEKPLTMTGAEAEAATAAAASAGVVLVEAMMYRFQPQTQWLRAALAEGLIGTPVHVDVSCAFTTSLLPGDRLFDPAAGGGAILDVGCYAMSFARMVAGWTADDDGVEPVEFLASGHLTETGVDDWAVASMVFPGGLTASVRTGTRLADDMQARIYGSEGHLLIPDPWTPGKDGRQPEVIVSRIGDDGPQVVPCASAPLFGAEIDALWEARDRGHCAAMSHRDSVATMRCLDRWRHGAGVR